VACRRIPLASHLPSGREKPEITGIHEPHGGFVTAHPPVALPVGGSGRIILTMLVRVSTYLYFPVGLFPCRAISLSGGPSPIS
jgi:hypothetical protein